MILFFIYSEVCTTDIPAFLFEFGNNQQTFICDFCQLFEEFQGELKLYYTECKTNLCDLRFTDSDLDSFWMFL